MIFNIALSKVLYEVARFGDKSVIGVLRVLTIIYGLGLVTVCVFYFLDW